MLKKSFLLYRGLIQNQQFTDKELSSDQGYRDSLLAFPEIEIELGTSYWSSFQFSLQTYSCNSSSWNDKTDPLY
ncbi:hypothetical protein halTADL_2885 [Halohasta litchfieldiae]|nr:hypothetical protein halTADL_2885 [Halohasta litchfieldiae]